MGNPVLKVKSNELVMAVAFYLFMMVNYYLVLWADSGILMHFRGVGLNHVLKALLTLPLWWFFIRFLAGVPFWKKALLHVIALPAFSFAWLYGYYALCEYFGIFYLKGSRQVWDFYHTALFYIIQFGLFHLFDYYVRHGRQELLVAQQRQLATQSELSALKAQLNPHFLYNVFNTINAAIPSQAESSRRMVAKLSDLFRYQLKASKEDFVSLKEELDFVRSYLELEKERFEERLDFRFDVDESALSTPILPILLQPLVENSIKHGISPLIEGGAIVLSVRATDDQLQMTIADTGVGFEGQSPEELLTKGVGLANTNERLIKVYGSGLKLREASPRGAEVHFSIPKAPRS